MIPCALVRREKSIDGDSISRGGDGGPGNFLMFWSLPVKIRGGLDGIDSVVRILTD